MGEKRDKGEKEPIIQFAEWPDDAPYPLEETIMSVVCGNTHLHWAMHGGKRDQYAPILFWRTPPLNEDERGDEPCTVLSRHLPSQAHALVFGDASAPGSKASANAVKAKRKVPAISIYVISTNAYHEEALTFLFSEVAVRLVKLRSKDFYTNEQGAYGTIGTDRVAAVKAGEKLYGAPLMVMDAGTAWTYTAMDRSKKILGGGIGPGLFSRFRCLSDYCDALPMIDYEKYNTAILEAIERNNPLPVFARDTEKGMLVSCVSEVGNQARSLVKHFLQTVGTGGSGGSGGNNGEKDKDKETGEKDTTVTPIISNANTNNNDNASEGGASKPTIVLTGGDAVFLDRVLEKSSSQLLGCEPGSELPAGDYHIYVMKHLVHYGIGHMLDEKPLREPKHPDDVLREKLVNLRVAKWFKSPDEEGDNIYRGSIIKISRGSKVEEDLFYVKYDDGDAEHLEIQEIYFMLNLYSETGEKGVREVWKEEKRQVSKAASDKVYEVDSLRNKIEEEKKKRAKRESTQAASRKRSAQGSPDGTNKRPKTVRKKKDKATMYIKKRIAKAFVQEGENGKSITEIFFGTIDRLSSKEGELPLLWHVQYDDDDEEEFDEKDVKHALTLYEKHKQDDPKSVDDNKASAVEAVPNTTSTATTSKPAPMDVDEPEKDTAAAAPGTTSAEEKPKTTATTTPAAAAAAAATTTAIPSTASAPAAADETKGASEAPKADTVAAPATDSSAPAPAETTTKPAETTNIPASSSSEPAPAPDGTDAKPDGESATNGDKPAAASAEGA